MAGFKVGQRVQCVDEYEGYIATGKVLAVDNDTGIVTIGWDDIMTPVEHLPYELDNIEIVK